VSGGRRRASHRPWRRSRIGHFLGQGSEMTPNHRRTSILGCLLLCAVSTGHCILSVAQALRRGEPRGQSEACRLAAKPSLSHRHHLRQGSLNDFAQLHSEQQTERDPSISFRDEANRKFDRTCRRLASRNKPRLPLRPPVRAPLVPLILLPPK